MKKTRLFWIGVPVKTHVFSALSSWQPRDVRDALLAVSINPQFSK